MQVPGPTQLVAGALNIAPCRAVYISGSRTVTQVTATTQFVLGVSQEGMSTAPGVLGSDAYVAAGPGAPISVVCQGNVGLVEISASVTAGNLLTADTNGRAIPLAAGSPSTQYTIGMALITLTAPGGGVYVRCPVWMLTQQIWF